MAGKYRNLNEETCDFCQCFCKIRVFMTPASCTICLFCHLPQMEFSHFKIHISHNSSVYLVYLILAVISAAFINTSLAIFSLMTARIHIRYVKYGFENCGILISKSIFRGVGIFHVYLGFHCVDALNQG